VAFGGMNALVWFWVRHWVFWLTGSGCPESSSSAEDRACHNCKSRCNRISSDTSWWCVVYDLAPGIPLCAHNK